MSEISCEIVEFLRDEDAAAVACGVESARGPSRPQEQPYDVPPTETERDGVPGKSAAIGCVDRILADISVWLFRRVDQRVDREELPCSGVVVAVNSRLVCGPILG
jgi:hypothetical protein